MSKVCAICGKPIDSGAVVHTECVPKWRAVATNGLPKEDGRYFVSCTTIVDGGWPSEDWKYFKTVTEAHFHERQKLWQFGADETGYLLPPINALIPISEFVGEDGELLQTGDFVTHWMPLPKPPKEASNETD